MIAFLRFLDLREVRLQLFLRKERGAVHALHRLIPRVAFPVGIRRRLQLEGLEFSGRRHMRPDAEIDKRVLVFDRVAGHFALAFGLLFDQLDLERLAARREELLGVLARPHLPFVDEILRRQVAHFLFDHLEIFRYERPRHDEVVEKSLVGRRTDSALHTGKQIGDRRRQQVSRAVAIERERLGALVRHDLDGGVLMERERQIDQLPVDETGQRGTGETWRDRLGDVANERTGWDLTGRSIWQCDCDLIHRRSCMWRVLSGVPRLVSCGIGPILACPPFDSLRSL